MSSQFRSSTSPHGAVQSPVTQLRLVLLGRTGSGKSATGNTILGNKCFPSKLSMESVTRKCQKECGEVHSQHLALIDTPGWFDTSLQQNDITDEVLRCLVMSSPGPHAFLLIIPIAHFTEEQQQTVDIIRKVFEEKISDHTIIIFTHADELEGQPVEQFISEQGQKIQDIIAQFGGRFLAFNNKNPENQDQVKELLEKVVGLLEQNENRHFTNQATEAVVKALAMLEQKRQEKLAESIRKAKQEVRKIAERRKADIIKGLDEEMQEIERCRKYSQGRIDQLKIDIKKENENKHADSCRLQRLNRYLKRENETQKNLEKEEQMRIEDSNEEEQELGKWIKEEQQRIEQEAEQEYLKEDESKWYNNEIYFSILKFVVVFLGGTGIGLVLGPLLFVTAPVGLAAELAALLGPELAATVMAAATNAAPFIAAAAKAALCSIQ